MTRSFGVDHLTLLDASPVELVRLAASAGYDSVGLRVKPVSASEPRWPLHEGSSMLYELQKVLRDTSIGIHQVEAIFMDELFDVVDIEKELVLGATLGAQFLLVVGIDSNLDRLADNFARLDELARSYGIRPMLEPMSYRPVSTIKTAKQVISRAQNGAVLVDCLHFFRAQEKLVELQQLTNEELALLQVCDGPKNPPPRQELRQEALSQRLLPGDGQFDLEIMVAARPSKQLISLEAPNPQLAQSMGYLKYLTRGLSGLMAMTEGSAWNEH